MHAFNQYSLNSFITVFETAVTGKRARPRWMGGTGNALLDQILPKPKKKGLWGRKVDMTNPNPNPNLNPNPNPNPNQVRGAGARGFAAAERACFEIVARDAHGNPFPNPFPNPIPIPGIR